MKKVVLIVAILMFLGFFQIQGYAVEYFNYNANLTTDFLGYNYFDQSAFNTTQSCFNIWSPLSWIYCYFWGEDINITSYTSCFDIEFNSSTYTDGGAEARTGFIDFEANDNCLWNGTYDYHKLAVTPHTSPSFCDVDNWDDYFNESICPYQLIEEIPRNREVIVYLRFLVNDTSGWDSNANYLVGFIWERNLTAGLGDYLESIDLEIYTETIEKPNDNDWTTAYMIIPANLYSDRTLGLTLHLGFGTVTNAKRILIDRFSVYTMDRETPAIVNSFTETGYAFVQQQCNTSSSVTGQVNFSSTDIGVDYKFVEVAFDGFHCGVLLVDNTTYTRRVEGYRAYAVNSSGTDSHEWFISRDMVAFRQYETDFQRMRTGLILRQIQPHLLEVIGLSGGNNSRESGGSLLFNNYGSIFFTDIYNESAGLIDHKISISASGDKFKINGSTAPEKDSAWHNVFYKTICLPRYVCEANTLWWINLDCSQVNITTCGVWGCNPEGNACNFPTNPLTNEPILTYGSFCLDNYTYFTVNGSGIYYDSCTFPDLCWQITDTTVQCASESEIEEGTITLERRGQNIFVQYLGIGLEEALWLLAFIVSFGISAFLGYKIERWGGIVFMGSLTSWLLIFTLIGWLPAIIGGIFVFVLALAI